jgi:hypothetical protein
MARGLEHRAQEHGKPHIARFTASFVRPVPIVPLHLEVEDTRVGTKSVELRATLSTADERKPLMVATALAVPSQPENNIEEKYMVPCKPSKSITEATPIRFEMFQEGLHHYAAAMELRLVHGRLTKGPCCMWFRTTIPLVALHEDLEKEISSDGSVPKGLSDAISPLQRVLLAADSCNGISSSVEWDEYLFMNPDITVHVVRPLIGEWVCMDARTDACIGGHGVSSGTLMDETGVVGHALQSLIVERRAQSTAPGKL